MRIKNRKELTEYLEERLIKSYEELKENQELEQSMLKTYLIESNLPSIEKIPKIEGYEYKIIPTEDRNLHILHVEDRKSKMQFYVDTLNPRFWLFHTLSKSIFTDKFIKKFVTSKVNHLDFPWLSIPFLENIGEYSIFRGFSLKYVNEFVPVDQEEIPVQKLSMRLWGNVAKDVLTALRNDKKLKHSIAIAGVGVKQYINSNGDFIISDITYQGKFTARGTSIDAYYYLLEKVKIDYEKRVKEIEEHSLSINEQNGSYRLSGKPFAIILKNEIEDLSKFVNILLSSRHPFRLWGVYKILDKNFIKVNAIDLHTGDELNLELTSEWFRVYIPKGSCGNSVMRLFTNIQHFYDSDAILEVNAI